MGQIIRLPMPSAAYPDAAAGLDRAGCALLLAVRLRVAGFRLRADPLPRPGEAMATAGARDAAFAVDRLMAVIVRSARRPMAVLCPRCPGLSGDEKEVPGAASLARAGDSRMAERALRAALLSAPGAEFALAPLQGLGELFAGARLFLRRRTLADAGGVPVGEVESWLPPAATRSVR
jgi:hypothetical protein